MNLFLNERIKKSLLLSTLYIFATSSLLSLLLQFINPTEYNGFSHADKAMEVIAVLILAPVIETVIFFWVPYKFIEGTPILQNKTLIYIVTSSLFFALAHLYNLNYFIETLYTGLLMANFVYENRINRMVFFELTLVHSIYNLLAIVINYIVSNWF